MFKNKVVVITGAGSGIGQALAVEFAKQGARLALSDINAAGLQATLGRLPGGTDAKTYVFSVASREQVYQHADDVKRDFGAAHFVINNAGTSIVATVDHVTIEEVERVLDVNLWGVIYGTKAFLPLMLAQKEGCIVNISSVFGLVAVPCQMAYTMSKFAIRGLTETLWQELEGTGVRAVVVHPGGINTNITQAPAAVNEGEFERQQKLGVSAMMTTTPEDCARQIVDGLRSGDNRLLVGNGAKQLHWISRLFPNSYPAILRRKHGS